MVAQPKPKYYTPEEYLALEREADFKSEYLCGEIYAMAGSTPEHSRITFNVTTAIGVQLAGTPCVGFTSDMKVRTTPTGLYSYPDLSIVCGEPQYHDEHRDVLINPVVLIEVLSDSTEAYDRGRKFENYQHLESLREYVLIAQDRPRVEHYARQSGNRWLLTILTSLEDSLHLTSIDCTLRLADVYDRITFPKSPDDEHPADSTSHPSDS